jgi:hypothetical protein
LITIGNRPVSVPKQADKVLDNLFAQIIHLKKSVPVQEL